MLELKNISKYYNTGTVNEMCLFNDFNLSIDDGEFVSVVGSNGSGKTSMLNLICGSIPVDSGTIVMGGTDITKMPEYKRQRRIGRVYQHPAMGTCPNMTILENMALADNKGKPFNLLPGTNKARIDFYRDQLKILGLGLEDKMGVKVGVLSGGQRQAMALLMSTMTPIEFLILDEHTAALDPKTAAKVLALSDKFIEEEHLTAMMVTHNMRDAIAHGNRLIMMNAGKIILDVRGQEKRALTVEALLEIFAKTSGSEFDNDRALPCVKFLHLMNGSFCLLQQPPCSLHGSVPGFVQFDFVLSTKEERHTESLLQMLHGAGNGRGGDMKFLRYAT